MTVAVNLDTSCLVLMPLFTLYAVANIIDNSPSAYIVKQVDYIVWKVIFLVLNLALVNLAIWWPLITVNSNAEPSPDLDDTIQKSKYDKFDFTNAKQVIAERLLPLDQSFGHLTLA